MFSRYDKAAAGVIGGALAAIIGVLLDLSPEMVVSFSGALTGLLVYLVPNKPNMSDPGGTGGVSVP